MARLTWYAHFVTRNSPDLTQLFLTRAEAYGSRVAPHTEHTTQGEVYG